MAFAREACAFSLEISYRFRRPEYGQANGRCARMKTDSLISRLARVSGHRFRSGSLGQRYEGTGKVKVKTCLPAAGKLYEGFLAVGKQQKLIN